VKVLLFGVGMQGKAALHDLANHQLVTEIIAADQEIDALKAYVDIGRYGDKVRCEHLDAGAPGQIDRLMSGKPDVAIDLLPKSFIGDITRAAVKHGVHLVNTNYAVPEAEELAEEAQSKGITILPEFGLDPGIDLVLLGEAIRNLDQVEEIYCYGSGIPEPEAANNPIKYKVTWTFDGVLGSYLRGGRIIRDGKITEIKEDEVFKPFNIHEIEIDEFGKLEAYPNGDAIEYIEPLGIEISALRNMGRYTLRWPGHCEFWEKIVGLHLLDDEPVYTEGKAVDRKRYLAAALGPQLQLGPDERDLAIIQVDVRGVKDDLKTRAIYQLVDRRDLKTGLTAMSRTVGFTTSIGAIMIGTGKITKRGLLSPIRDIPYDTFIQELSERDIQITFKQEPAK
jgi:saccharopine dehydrogenase-like NADP-dependent oxidoreductase